MNPININEECLLQYLTVGAPLSKTQDKPQGLDPDPSENQLPSGSSLENSYSLHQSPVSKVPPQPVIRRNRYVNFPVEIILKQLQNIIS
jgi:hypothetical protein